MHSSHYVACRFKAWRRLAQALPCGPAAYGQRLDGGTVRLAANPLVSAQDEDLRLP